MTMVTTGRAPSVSWPVSWSAKARLSSKRSLARLTSCRLRLKTSLAKTQSKTGLSKLTLTQLSEFRARRFALMSSAMSIKLKESLTKCLKLFRSATTSNKLQMRMNEWAEQMIELLRALGAWLKLYLLESWLNSTHRNSIISWEKELIFRISIYVDLRYKMAFWSASAIACSPQSTNGPSLITIRLVKTKKFRSPTKGTTLFKIRPITLNHHKLKTLL